jgi:signal transduction histidine kinase/uncharacterized protein HemY
MLRPTFLLCLNLLLLGEIAFGQTPIDSLEQKLQTSVNEQKVDILNQLTYEFISKDEKKVNLYNTQALKLSDQIRYKKGQGVAFTYKGVYEYLSGQFPAARNDLHRGLKLSEEAGDQTNKAYTLLQLGNCSLEEVENDSALLYLTKAHKLLRDSTNPVTLSKVYRNLSAVYGQRYQYDLQQSYLDRAIAIRRLLPDKGLLAEALSLKANNAVRLGDLRGAESIIREVEQMVKTNPNDEERQNDLRHLKALVLFQQGKFEEAMGLVDAAREYYFKVSLFRKYVTLLIDISKVFSDQGEYEIALNNLYAALRLSQLRGFDSETYAIRNRIGWINFNLGDYEQALQLANEALNTNMKRQLKPDQASALTLKGVAFFELNDFKQAKISLDHALAIYTDLNDVRGLSETLMNLGSLAKKQNQHAVALPLYQKSIELAKISNYYFGIAWSSWGLGELYLKKGDFKNASVFLDQCEEYAMRIRANEVLIHCYNTRRDLFAAQKKFEEALLYSIKASQLNDSIHRTDLVRRFLNLEKIEAIEQRDRDIKVLQQDKQLAENKIYLQESKLRQQYFLLIAGLVGLTLLSILAFAYYRFYSRIKLLNITITGKNNRIQAQADKLHDVNVELSRLYSAVSERNEEIESQAVKLVESNRNISDLNRNLERIVAEKTVELRKTNEELVKYNQELLQFSYTVSHNLRGPVARLLGLSELAHTEEELDKAKNWINLINKTTGDLDVIIKDISKLLDLRNEPNQYRENVDLEKEWQQSTSLLADVLSGDEIIVSHFAEFPALNTVRAFIQSVFYNLLSNAIKFRSLDRKLKVTATSRYEDGNLIIEVTDNGLGFDTHIHKEKLFKLYKRFHTHVAGRGLGLYLIKAQLDVLHGTIEVESKLDYGSVFRISIPVEDKEMKPLVVAEV